MVNIFNAEQAREYFKLATSNYLEIYDKILKSIEYNSKKGINPVYLSYTIATLTQENID
ncbi:hypothetical protein [Acinetobacter bereziniae]|uniref:hypothetical protein n=1 Tax=Acinetobacter bereziniae TaxID=106648 RepID=UPI0029548440|nr:hypothetical protein [Acinetobacter bereziniae]MDV8155630.1 hypothetical protein [Acinetobacter bereziniae]